MSPSLDNNLTCQGVRGCCTRKDQMARLESKFMYGTPTSEAEPGVWDAWPIHACAAEETVTNLTWMFVPLFVQVDAVTFGSVADFDAVDCDEQPSTAAIACTAERADTHTVAETPDPRPPFMGRLVSAVPWM